MLRKPRRLEPGDTIGIVAPASAPPDPEAIDRSVETIRQLGFTPLLAPNVRKRHGFLAGTDRERASDLMKMFRSRRVNGIICVRGGYGTARLLPLLDYQVIAENPKAFLGYSDITSLHCAFFRYAGLIAFHGPMLNSDFIKPDCPAFTRESCLRILMQAEPAGSILWNLPRTEVEVLRKGEARGRLIGGNLSLLCASLGTPYQPSLKGRILFLEDLDEPPYRFDRMLTQLLNAGLLQQVAGIAIGVNSNCEDPKRGESREYRQTLRDVLVERLMPLKVPLVMNLPFGHVALNATLPFGGLARLDAQNGDLLIEEAVVR